MNILEVCNKLQCGQAGLARLLGVSRATVNVWVKNQEIPLARQYQIQDLLEGKKPLGVEPFHTPESITGESE